MDGGGYDEIKSKIEAEIEKGLKNNKTQYDIHWIDSLQRSDINGEDDGIDELRSEQFDSVIYEIASKYGYAVDREDGEPSIYTFIV